MCDATSRYRLFESLQSSWDREASFGILLFSQAFSGICADEE